ncbi:MAG TPA: Fur family transcriptional regulator [Stellaceae bacterium]|jgi:Fur family zinc uptake transcriptional regulator
MNGRIERGLHMAERCCAARGVNLTPLRRRVLELILNARQPVGAYLLLGQLQGSREKVGPPTVYRALEFLLEQKLIHRIESLNAYIACVDADHPHESQFVICTDCGSTEELHDDGIVESLRRHGRDLGYEISGQIVELRGLCAHCRGAEIRQ